MYLPTYWFERGNIIVFRIVQVQVIVQSGIELILNSDADTAFNIRKSLCINHMS